MDPIALRRKNFIPKFDNGYQTKVALTYDSGAMGRRSQSTAMPTTRSSGPTSDGAGPGQAHRRRLLDVYRGV
jgi:hypothetical protein